MYAVGVALLGPGGDVDDVVQDASLDAELRAVGGGPLLRGADAITRALEGDIAAGGRLRPLDAIAGRDITVREGLCQPQGGDADGVPVMTTQVFFQQGDAITAIRTITG